MRRYPEPAIGRLAGILDRRFEAVFLDVVTLAIVVGALGYVGGVLVGSELPIVFAVLGIQLATPLAIFPYHIAMEGYFGQTVGKYSRGIVVVKDDGSSCTWGAALVRNVVRIVDMLPFAYLLGIVVGYASDDNKRLGDLAAGTKVVHTAE